MTLSCITISWTSTTGVRGELAETSLLSFDALSCMKAPVAFCWGTVARTHACLTVTSAWEAVAANSMAARESERVLMVMVSP
ncbi:hypothetical protein D9M72_573800 [compost metagenome]